jgi:UDP-N-acetylglucosamine--N-acetylmuramyl-(pentapeptide) pyrophosphoryl-undecaprenol N-acetylglucosamine transferase
MKIIISAGGTGGHLYPAIRLGELIKEREKSISLLFVTKEKNYDLIKKKGFECEILYIENKIFSLFKNFLNSLKILRKHKPDLVIGMGSYISVPVVCASFFLRIPVLIHEQNVLPGKANRFLSIFSTKILISFKETEKFFYSRKKICLVGNPLRKIKDKTKEAVYKELNLDLNKKTILVFGGSQGAKKINESILNSLNFLKDKENLQILHITGKDKFEKVKVEKEKIKNLKVKYIILDYYEDLLEILKFADLVICRSGATTCSEIAFLGKPAIFIPYPYATGRHQEYNAKIFEKNNGAIVLKDRDVSGEKLANLIIKLFNNEEELKKMGERNKNLYIQFEIEKFMKIIYSLI